MKYIFLLLFLFINFSLFAAYQYNVKGNQGWLTFDTDTIVSFDLGTSGKDKDHVNFIDRGEGIADYGWYNMETGETGSFNNGLSATFKETDKIGLYVTDNSGKTYLSTKPKNNYSFENDIWGKSKYNNGLIYIAGGNFGSNGTHEYYVFRINTSNPNKNSPNGQPLPGVFATLILGGIIIWYLKNRKYFIHA
jgi:hypothetical protein